jgi:hypothetical protein
LDYNLIIFFSIHISQFKNSLFSEPGIRLQGKEVSYTRGSCKVKQHLEVDPVTMFSNPEPSDWKIGDSIAFNSQIICYVVKGTLSESTHMHA